MDLTIQLESRKMTQQEHLDVCCKRAARSLCRAQGFLNSTPDELNWSPPSGVWTIGQVFDHLVKSGESYERQLDAILGATRGQKRPTDAFSPTFIGRMILRNVGPGNHAPVPKLFRPSAEPFSPEIIARLIAHLDVIQRFCEDSTVDLSRKLSSPVSPLVRIRTGDALAIMTVHAEHHLNQAEERRALYQASQQ